MKTTTEQATTGMEPEIFKPATESGMTRRSFLKRTAATILVTVLAINGFAEENSATNGGSSSVKYIFPVMGAVDRDPEEPDDNEPIPSVAVAITDENQHTIYHRTTVQFAHMAFDPPNRDEDDELQPAGKRTLSVNVIAIHQTAPAPQGPWTDTNERIETGIELSAENPNYENEGNLVADGGADMAEDYAGSLGLIIQITKKYDSDEKPRGVHFKVIAMASLWNSGIPSGTGNYSLPSTANEFDGVPQLNFPDGSAKSKSIDNFTARFDEVKVKVIPGEPLVPDVI